MTRGAPPAMSRKLHICSLQNLRQSTQTDLSNETNGTNGKKIGAEIMENEEIGNHVIPDASTKVPSLMVSPTDAFDAATTPHCLSDQAEDSTDEDSIEKK
jgi:hypothetical protein